MRSLLLFILLLTSAPAFGQGKSVDQAEPQAPVRVESTPVQQQPAPQVRQQQPRQKTQAEIWWENSIYFYIPVFLIFYLASRLAQAHGPLRLRRKDPRLSEEEHEKLRQILDQK